MQSAPMKRASDLLAIRLEDVPPGELGHVLHREVKSALLSGRFDAGFRMPSSCTFARQLGVSRNTVVDVYERPVVQGCLSTRHGSGTFVSDSVIRVSTSPSRQGTSPSTADTQSCSANFRPGLPDLKNSP